jgi:hypothetical protein
MSQAASAATLASFAASAKKDELVLFLAHCGEKHAGSVDAARAAAIAYVASQPHRAAAALAGLRRRADPPAGSVFTDITRAARGDIDPFPPLPGSPAAGASSPSPSAPSLVGSVGDGDGITFGSPAYGARKGASPSMPFLPSQMSGGRGAPSGGI